MINYSIIPSGDLIRLYTAYRISVKLRLFSKIIKHTGLHIYTQTRTTIDDRIFPTQSIYTHVFMKYICKKNLTNCNFVLKLLTINKKAMQHTYLKKNMGEIRIITHTIPTPLFYFRDLL